MNEKAYKILKTIYRNQNSTFDSKTATNTFCVPSIINPNDIEYLCANNIAINTIQLFSHDEVVRRLIDIAVDVRISPERIANSFIAGVGGSYPRGLQPIISYYYAKHLTRHDFISAGGYTTCEDCGVKKAEWKNVSYEIFHIYWGYAWNEIPIRYLIDLEEFADQPQVEPTPQDVEIFNKLLKAISLSTEGETPSLLEKRLAKEKIIPKVDKYRRYGILEALAEVGVLPNTIQTPSIDRFVSPKERWENSKTLKGNIRSDIVLPFGAWRGDLGIDFARARDVFGDFICTY